jgi:hypothetical protein
LLRQLIGGLAVAELNWTEVDGVTTIWKATAPSTCADPKEISQLVCG